MTSSGKNMDLGGETFGSKGVSWGMTCNNEKCPEATEDFNCGSGEVRVWALSLSVHYKVNLPLVDTWPCFPLEGPGRAPTHPAVGSASLPHQLYRLLGGLRTAWGALSQV